MIAGSQKNECGWRREHSVVEAPGHVVDTADRDIRKLLECSWSEVKVEFSTGPTAVCDVDGDLLALVLGGDGHAADGVIVGVAAGVAGPGVEQDVRNSGNVIAIGVCDTAST